MRNTPLAMISRLFREGYDDLKQRLAQRVGSADLAGEAMHEAWLRIAGRETGTAVLDSERYLFRTALNAATDSRRRERRHGRSAELDQAAAIADPRRTAEEELIANEEIEAFERIVAELPPRRRAIFLAARVGNVPRQAIADEMRISRRLVTRELMLAHKHCLSRWKEMMD